MIPENYAEAVTIWREKIDPEGSTPVATIDTVDGVAYNLRMWDNGDMTLYRVPMDAPLSFTTVTTYSR